MCDSYTLCVSTFRKYSLRLVLLSAALIAVALPAESVSGQRNKPETLDVLASIRSEKPLQLSDAMRDLVDRTRGIQQEKRFGLPTFVWAARGHESLSPSGLKIMLPESAARMHLKKFAPLYGFTDLDVQNAERVFVHDTGRGAIIVKFHRSFGGIEVFRDEMSIVMDRSRELVAISGFLPGQSKARQSPLRSFKLGAAQAAARALSDWSGKDVGPRTLSQLDRKQGPYRFLEYAGSILDLRVGTPIRYKKVFFHMPDQLVPAYYLELEGSVENAEGGTSSEAYSYVISAMDGSILFRHNLVADDSFSYRVWADSDGHPWDGPQGLVGTPHPTGTPDGYQAPNILPVLITLQNGPISTNDPWLPSGATETNGNNIDAYADLASPDGLTAGDFRASTTSPNTFDRTYDTTMPPSVSADQRMASVTQLFVVNNFLHDWFYDAGFDEISGNAQADNYGRGGVDGDSMRAEAQDFSGLNNANMSTPPDGGRPRMQMFVFSGTSHLTVNSPAGIAGTYSVGTAAFGPISFNHTGNVVQALDPSDVAGPSTTDGCSPLTNAAAIAGNIALIDRGTCAFTIKATNAQNAGASGIIIANNSGTLVISMVGTCAGCTIPILSVSLPTGNLIKANLGTGVNATMFRGVPVDGTIDNQIVAHEWGHYISNRLIGNTSGLGNNQGRSMGEGWGDFHTLLITIRDGDDFSGAYAAVIYAMIGLTGIPPQNFYFGIRRIPYSTDFTKNALTFQHIENGVALPAGNAILPNGAANSEVHNSGEIWATMLWECYAALLNSGLSFADAQSRMINYLVASYKATPVNPTFTEARDALLSVAFANDPADGALFCDAFATRGIGQGAVSPDRFSTNHAGVVESYVCSGDLIIVDVTLDVTGASCDSDVYLDAGESGILTVTIKNIGGVTLSNPTATVTSTNGAVTIANGGNLSFPATDPFETTSAQIGVTIDPGTAGIQIYDFDITVSDMALPGPVGPETFEFVGNQDDILASSSSDDVESDTVVWTIGGGPGVWERVEDGLPLDHHWLGEDIDVASDHYLISPPLDVAPTGDFTFSFDHRFSFEFDTFVDFDGGVLEISTDGTNWNDIGAFAATGYNGTLSTCCKNPLQTRDAYTKVSSGYPSFVTETVDLGTAYQGQTVRVRFRIGTDAASGDVGWEIDDIVFNNITNTPFATVIAQPPDIPVITCPPQTVLATSSLGAIVNYPAPAVQSCPGVTSACVLPSGSQFPIGTTPVICTATSTSNNASMCSFNVNVLPPIGNAVVVDPAGRFVLYTEHDFGCGSDVLKYRALNASGHPTGAPVTIVPCGLLNGDVVGVDILRDGTTDNYLVSFGSSTPTDGKYAMKMNASGTVLTQPKSVVPASAYGSVAGGTALQSKGKARLFLFISGAGGSIYRTKLDKASLALLGVKKTSLMNLESSALQATQNVDNRFLAMENPTDVLKAFGLNAKGLPDGRSWRLSPRTDGGNELGGVSADGLMAFSNDYDPSRDQLYLQPLKGTGLPNGDPSIIANDHIRSVDVSNELAGGMRFAVYVTDQNMLFLQVVDSHTGAGIGARILIN